MASEGHPPSSHAQFESALQQALKDFQRISEELDLSTFSKVNAPQRNGLSTIIVVTPLVEIMKYQVKQWLRSIGFRAVAISCCENSKIILI